MNIRQLQVYFEAERDGAMFVLGIGLVFLIFVSFLWVSRSMFIHMAWPMALFALLAIGMGGYLIHRTPAQLADLEQGFDSQMEQTVEAEQVRMNKVNNSLLLLKWGEAVMILVGLGLVMFLPTHTMFFGLGLGLLVTGAVALVFDSFAHYRAEEYAFWLQGLVS